MVINHKRQGEAQSALSLHLRDMPIEHFVCALSKDSAEPAETDSLACFGIRANEHEFHRLHCWPTECCRGSDDYGRYRPGNVR